MSAKKRKYKKRTKKKVSFFKKYKKYFSILSVLMILSFVIYGLKSEIGAIFTTNKSKTEKYLDKKLLAKMDKMLKEERKKVDILQKELKKETNKKDKKIKSKKSVVTTVEKNTTSKIASVNSYIKIKNSEYDDYKKSLQKMAKTEKKIKPEKIAIKSSKPMMAIIIDDVSFKEEVKKIKSLPFRVTPSFLPPTKRHPDTPKYAKEFSFYMVHLPLEASHYSHQEKNTLLVSNSAQEIENRIEAIKRWFPKCRFVNNHTGSTFTADYKAMKRLYKALVKNDIVFVDSRTTAQTKAPLVSKEFHQKLISRKIFIDNKPDEKYIKDQLKKAIKLAKKNGFVVAIGHPRRSTFQALSHSSYILKDVDVVYLDKIYENSYYVAK